MRVCAFHTIIKQIGTNIICTGMVPKKAFHTAKTTAYFESVLNNVGPAFYADTNGSFGWTQLINSAIFLFVSLCH